jgi:hypothetical protein
MIKLQTTKGDWIAVNPEHVALVRETELAGVQAISMVNGAYHEVKDGLVNLILTIEYGIKDQRGIQ